MGREVRRVPANWNHPKKANGDFIPLLDYSYTKASNEWEEGFVNWQKGLTVDYEGGWKPLEDNMKSMSYYEYNGDRPDKSDYMPEWSESEKTHLQMYETCTEGTPISPVMDCPIKLAQWLVDNNASAFGNSTASYDAWLATISRGFAISMVVCGGEVMSGVEANLKM